MAHRSRPTIRFNSSNSNVVGDGNSLMAGDGADFGFSLPLQLAALAPISGAFAINNLGIGGQTTRQMNGLDGGSSADVDAAFNASKQFNVLFAWELTNTIQFTNRNAASAVNDMALYCAARKAAHPGWKIILIGTLPRYQVEGNTNGIVYTNEQLLAADKMMAANYRAMGADAFVDLRVAGGPFDFTDWSLPTFDRAQTKPMWSTTDDPAIRVHQATPGYGFVARQCSNVLHTMKVE